MPKATRPGKSAATPPQTYAPSVPISLYREVSTELESIQASLDSLTAQNQQLVQENQELRRELDRVIQAGLQLQQAINAVQETSPVGNFPMFSTPSPAHSGEIPLMSPSLTTEATSPPFNPSVFPFAQTESTSPINSDKLFTEEAQPAYRLRSQPKKSSDVSGVWLAIAICLIIVTAFGAGYWFVRPILMKR